MVYGGTNWGGLSFPDVVTSYDYSAPIYESRQIGAKYSESKLLGLQLRTLRDLTMTEWIGVSHVLREIEFIQLANKFYRTLHTPTIP